MPRPNCVTYAARAPSRRCCSPWRCITRARASTRPTTARDRARAHRRTATAPAAAPRRAATRPRRRSPRRTPARATRRPPQRTERCSQPTVSHGAPWRVRKALGRWERRRAAGEHRHRADVVLRAEDDRLAVRAARLPAEPAVERVARVGPEVGPAERENLARGQIRGEGLDDAGAAERHSQRVPDRGHLARGGLEHLLLPARP